MITRRDVYQAIADPTRRAILTLLAAGALTPGAIANTFNSSRQTISKHIQILTECELLVQKPGGREIRYHLNPQKLNEIDNWLEQFRKLTEDRLDRLENYLAEVQNNQTKTGQTKLPKMKNQEERFEITYLFEADPAKVFEMWTNPESFSKWLGPEGADMEFITSNVKEGGTSRWSMTTTDGLTKYGELHFKIINPSNMIVYTQNFCDKDGNFSKAPFSETYPDRLVTTVYFVNENPNQTKVIVRWEIFGKASETERQTFREMKEIMKIGWTASFKKLEAMLKIN